MWQNSNCDKTQTVTKLEIQIVTKLKNSICDKTQKQELWQNLKTQIVTKLKIQIVTKLKLWEKKEKYQILKNAQKLKLWQN